MGSRERAGSESHREKTAEGNTHKCQPQSPLGCMGYRNMLHCFHFSQFSLIFFKFCFTVIRFYSGIQKTKLFQSVTPCLPSKFPLPLSYITSPRGDTQLHMHALSLSPSLPLYPLSSLARSGMLQALESSATKCPLTKCRGPDRQGAHRGQKTGPFRLGGREK